jgi:hypothetical protein
MGQNVLADFVDQHCFRLRGHKLKFSQFWEAFRDRYLPIVERPKWSKLRTINELEKLGIHRGRWCNQVYIANLGMETHEYHIIDGKLRKEPLQ